MTALLLMIVIPPLLPRAPVIITIILTISLLSPQFLLVPLLPPQLLLALYDLFIQIFTVVRNRKALVIVDGDLDSAGEDRFVVWVVKL